jgi:MinD-like ATPase involved in chromosome partitioning or flagellar assembly
MKRLVAAMGSKGGTGKSKTERTFYDLFRSRGRRIAAFDLDASNGSFASYAPDAIKIDDLKGSAAWLDAAYDDSIDDVLVDVPGGHVADFAERVAASPAALADAVSAAGRELVIVTVIGIESDETMQAITTLETWARTSARIVVALNGRDGDVADFIIFEDEVASAVSAAGASTIWVPRIPSRLRASLSKHNVTMLAARSMAREIGHDAALNAKYYLEACAAQWQGTWLDADGEGDGSVTTALPGVTVRKPSALVTAP